MSSNSFLWGLLALLVGLLVGFWAWGGSGSQTQAQGITLPDDAQKMSECVPEMGEHWANPDVLSEGGPVYVVHDDEVVGVEYIVMEEAAEAVEESPAGIMGAMNTFDAFGANIDHATVQYVEESEAEIGAPHYAIHLLTIPEAEKANICPVPEEGSEE